MKSSFVVKFGLALSLAFFSVTIFLLFSFQRLSLQLARDNMEDAGLDMINLAAYVFDEESRDVLQNLRHEVLRDLRPTLSDEIRVLSAAGDSTMVVNALEEDRGSELRMDLDYQKTVQLLRRIAIAKSHSADALELISASETGKSCTQDGLPIRSQADSSGFVWTYLATELPNVDPQDAMLIVASSVSPNDMSSRSLQLERWVTFRPPSEVSAIYSGAGSVITEWYRSPFFSCGNVVSIAQPVRNERGEIIAVLGADYSISHIEYRLNELKEKFLLWFLVIVVLVLVAAYLMISWVAVPLSKLREGAEALEKNDFGFTVRWRSEDEFGYIAATMNRVSNSLGKLMGSLESEVDKRTQKLVVANKRIEELNTLLQQDSAYLNADVIALNTVRESELQRSIGALATGPLTVGPYRVEYGFSLSALAAGHFARCDKGSGSHFGLTLGEVCGNGARTVIKSLQLSSLLDGQDVTSPVNLVEAMNTFLARGLDEKDECIADGVSLHIEQHTLRLAGGYCSPLVFNTADVGNAFFQELGFPLGVSLESVWELAEIDLDTHSVAIFNHAFKVAVLRLREATKRELSAAEFLALSQLGVSSLSAIFDELKALPWFSENHEDCCCVVIGRA